VLTSYEPSPRRSSTTTGPRPGRISWSQIQPADSRWINLMHPDGDHSGSLMEILGAAPNAHLITKSLGLGIRPVWYVIRTVS
jgi:hypothetical protein